MTSFLAPSAAISGPRLFARYAYPPNALGYCGPNDPAALLQAAADPVDRGELAHRAAQFEGAWPYLQLIAACAGLDDPLDPRVVEAYWIGNPLSWRVGSLALARSLDERFEKRSSAQRRQVTLAALAGGVPQHSFHVFAVYPWLGLLRAGQDGPPLQVLDRCRIRWGRVEAVDGELVTVTSQALTFAGSRLSLGPHRIELVRASLAGVGFVDDLSPGDHVALHWDWVCDRLTPQGLAWLRASTSKNLDVVNSLASPGPAVVCGA